MYLPHELGSESQNRKLEATRILSTITARARNSGEIDDAFVVDYQDDLWRSFLTLCSSNRVIQTKPKILDCVRVQHLLIQVLIRKVRIGAMDRRTASEFLHHSLLG